MSWKKTIENHVREPFYNLIAWGKGACQGKSRLHLLDKGKIVIPTAGEESIGPSTVAQMCLSIEHKFDPSSRKIPHAPEQISL